MYKSFPSEEMWLENLNFFSRKEMVFLLFYLFLLASFKPDIKFKYLGKYILCSSKFSHMDTLSREAYRRNSFVSLWQ